MNLTINCDREIVGGRNTIGSDSENGSETLSFTLADGSLWKYSAYIEFLTEDGKTYTTDALAVSQADGTFSYALPNGLMQAGCLTVQAVLRNSDGTYVYKSEQRLFVVKGSVNAGDALALKYPDFIGSAEQVLEDATKASEKAAQAAADAKTAVDDAATAVASTNTAVTAASQATSAMESLESSVESAEQVRAETESRRQSAETSRASAENVRKQNEQDREASEQSRVTAENNRVSAEDSRVAAEKERATAEAGRVASENERKTNESARQNQESTRESNESTRVSEENSRKTAEAGRVTEFAGFRSEINARIPNVPSPVEGNLPKLNSDGTLADSGISAYNVINRVHWTIIATGSDPAVKLGGDATGLTDEQLMQLYPFNDTRIETVQLYGSDKATKLAGEDKFLSMPNAYYYFESTGTDGSFVFHMSNCKVDENYKKMVDYPYISRLLLAKYKANDDGTYLRSESGAEPAHNMTLTTAIGKLPYAKTDTDKFKRLDVGDKRARAMFFWMAMAKLNTRDFQSKYRGMTSYSYNNGDWTIIPDKLRLNGSTDVLGNGLITGEISSYVDDSSVTQAIAVNCRPFEILGVENPYGFIWEQIYGLYSKDREIYSYDGLDELTADQCNPGSANFAASDTGKQLPNTNGWQSTVDIVGAYQVPTAVTGSEGKYDSDYYRYASGNQLALVGGAWYDGGDAGLSYLNVRYAFAGAASHVGFRLSLLI